MKVNKIINCSAIVILFSVIYFWLFFGYTEGSHEDVRSSEKSKQKVNLAKKSQGCLFVSPNRVCLLFHFHFETFHPHE